MRASQAKRQPAAFGTVAICLLSVLGCDPVQEDRTIGFAPSGDHVAFQHGSGGVFVADPRTGALQKVFDPEKSSIAASTPQWSPDETQVIFATARNAGPSTAVAPPTGTVASGAADDGVPPEGRSFDAQPILYTCWFVQRSPNGTFTPATKLFDAYCNHAGYVAANLAIRWFPDQKAVLFVDLEPNGKHAIWSYELVTKKKRHLFPRSGQTAPRHVIADFTPDGSHLACVASGSGIWVGSQDGLGWRHIAESVGLQPDEALNSVIARRPVWTRDGMTFTFVQSTPGDIRTAKIFLSQQLAAAKPADRPAIAKALSQVHEERGRAVLFRGRVADGKVDKVFATGGEIVDPHWSPEGFRIGFVTTDPDPSLMLIDSHNRVRQASHDQFVRHFAGWNAGGDKLAYVAAEQPSSRSSARWAFLLWPDPLARDAVWIVDTNGPVRAVASGLRFTFPTWSSKRDEISIWGTFTPSYRSPANEWQRLSLGLRRGDPAAIIDVSTGGIRWLAVDGDEIAQVGHYFLLKRDYAHAREWYQRAEKLLPKLEPLHSVDLALGLSGVATRRLTFEFFYWYCLTKLGELNEAAVRLAAFDEAHRIQWPPDAPPLEPKGTQPDGNNRAAALTSPAARRETERLVAILKALTIAQVFLSVDDAEGARAFFNRQIVADNSLDRLGSLLVLTQLHLLKNGNREYAEFVTNQVGPLLADLFDDRSPDWTGSVADESLPIRIAVLSLIGHAMGPLFCDAFMKELPAEVVSQIMFKWEALRDRCHSQAASLGVNLVLRAAATCLGREKDRNAAAARIQQNPAGVQLLPGEGIESYFSSWRSLNSIDGRPGPARLVCHRHNPYASNRSEQAQ